MVKNKRKKDLWIEKKYSRQPYLNKVSNSRKSRIIMETLERRAFK